MPVLEVLGFIGNDELRLQLIKALKVGVASINELGIIPQQVTPFILPAYQENPGQVVVIKVVGLFDNTNRTPKVRQALAERIFRTVWSFYKMHHNSTVEFVEVIIQRTKEKRDGYFGANPQTWLPKDLSEK